MLNLNNKENLFDYVNGLMNIPSTEIVHLFKTHHVYLPDYFHRFVLKETLNKYFFDKELFKTYTDEYIYRLRAYKSFPIYLLEKNISLYEIKPNPAEYKKLFFKLFLTNVEMYRVDDQFFTDLDTLRNKFVNYKKEEAYNDTIQQFHKIFYTPKGYLDGVCLNVLKESLVHSLTLVELRELGEKYGVDVPRRINKGKLLEIISARLKLPEEEIQNIQKKSVLDLEIYAKKNGFKISTDFKKSDMVEYIIYSLGKYHQDIEQDLHNYDVLEPEEKIEIEDFEEIDIESSDQTLPTSNSFVEKSDEDIIMAKDLEEDDYVEVEVEEEAPEEVVEEIVEETPEEVEEEVVVEEEPVVLKEKVEEKEEEVKEEPAPVVPAEEIAPEVYYDSAIDDEIKRIIRSYYKKKTRFYRVIIILLVLALCAGGFAAYWFLFR